MKFRVSRVKELPVTDADDGENVFTFGHIKLGFVIRLSDQIMI